MRPLRQPGEPDVRARRERCAADAERTGGRARADLLGLHRRPVQQRRLKLPGAAVDTPFFLFTNGTNPRSLFADAYQPGAPLTGAASAVTTDSATVAGSVNPNGASVSASFQFGTTTAYGQSTPAQRTGPDNTVDQFSAPLSGLPAGTTIHYRAVAVSDFGTFVGADQTFRTQAAAGQTSVGNASVSGTTAGVPVSCTGQPGATCQLTLVLTANEQFDGRRLGAFHARRHIRSHHESRVVGRTNVTLTTGQSQTVQVALNHAGRELLDERHHLTATLLVFQVLPDGHVVTVSSQTVTFNPQAPQAPQALRRRPGASPTTPRRSRNARARGTPRARARRSAARDRCRFRTWMVDNRHAEDHERNADCRAEAGQRSANGFDHDRDGRDEERPCIHTRGRPRLSAALNPR